MKTYLTRAETLRRYNITETELDHLLQAERLDTVRLLDTGGEKLAFYDDDLAAYVADRDITPEKFDHLRGNLLGMNEAGLKHGVTSSTISRWVKQGQLEVKGTESRNKKLVDEADVAYLAELGRAKKMRPGKKVFD